MKKKKRELVPFLSPLHFATPVTQPTENIYLKSALKYVQTIQDATAPQLLKADFCMTVCSADYYKLLYGHLRLRTRLHGVFKADMFI